VRHAPLERLVGLDRSLEEIGEDAVFFQEIE
jgi:hypothetical protein